MNEQPVNYGRLRLISGAIRIHIRDAVVLSGFYPDLRIFTKFGAEMAPTTGKS